MRRAETSVRHLLKRWDFRRLLATRLAAQFGDGVLQAALAGTVLFNPQRAADPLDVALGFAVLLLPYSLVGPFAGVWLDRWSRRQVLVRAGLVRAALVAGLAALVWAGVAGAGFYLVGLAVFSVNRFVLSALSAALPHTADEPSLVSANALTTTCGAVATVGGGAVAVGLLQLGDAGNGAYALLTLASAVPYLVSAGVVARFSREHLGPDHPAGSPALSVREVVAGMVAGAQHAWERPPAAAALAVITAHRLCFGLITLMSMLLFRNTFTTGGLVPGGLAGLGLVVAAGAGGSLLAAAVTPAVVRRLGKPRWVSVLLASAGPALVGLSLPFLPVTAVLVGLVLGFVGQAVKICVDTTLQESMEDDFRGRVFSVYDTLVNVSYVTALVAAALLLPPSGISVALVVTVGAVYAVSAVASLRIAR